MAMVLAKQGTLDKLRNEGAGMRPSCDESMANLPEGLSKNSDTFSFHDAHRPAGAAIL